MRPRQIRPRQLFLALAQAVAVMWTLLIVGVSLTVVHDQPNVGVGVLLLIHGLGVLLYALASLALWVNHRWSPGVIWRALLAGVLPFATLWFEAWSEQRHLLAGPWRLEDPEGAPDTWRDRVLHWVLRRPAAALVTGGLTLAVGTTALLDAGFTVSAMPGAP